MNFLSKQAAAIEPYVAGEQRNDRQYIKLNTNENPYPPSPRAAAALAQFSAEGLRRYPRPDAGTLRRAIAAAEGVGEENVFCGNGSDEVLALSFPAFFDPDGAPACFAEITYSFYRVFAAFFQIPARIVPMRGAFELDLDAMLAAPCRGYYIANPNAPTGVGIPRAQMEDFVRAAAEKGRVVVADEAYIDFFGESLVPLTARYENLLVVKTFSKSYSLAGMRCGYAVGNAALIRGMFRMKDCFNSYPVDSVAEAVCTAALQDGAYHAETVQKIVSERERVRGALLALGFTVPESKANFLFAGGVHVGGGEIYRRLREQGVLVRHWDTPALRDFCRITVGTPAENDVLLQKLTEILR